MNNPLGAAKDDIENTTLFFAKETEGYSSGSEFQFDVAEKNLRL